MRHPFRFEMLSFSLATARLSRSQGLSLRVMTAHADIVGMAMGHPVMAEELAVMEERSRRIPGSWQFAMRRYRRPISMQAEDSGLLIYEHVSEHARDRFLGLRFCLSGYACQLPRQEACGLPLNGDLGSCEHAVPVLEAFSFDFGPSQLAPFARGQHRSSELQDLLAFRKEGYWEKSVPMDGRIAVCLREMSRHPQAHGDIFLNAQAQLLLIYTLEALYGDEEAAVPACKFLANNLDREKIVKAREVLLEHIGEPITIRELSRKVAINECYLKKGFKVLYGSTIFDFYQGQRMEHARYLLHEKGLSVSEVSLQLGYSSISHFSTAFKKHTGLKPCELLTR